jgi:hypothetical protein
MPDFDPVHPVILSKLSQSLRIRVILSARFRDRHSNKTQIARVSHQLWQSDPLILQKPLETPFTQIAKWHMYEVAI